MRKDDVDYMRLFISLMAYIGALFTLTFSMLAYYHGNVESTVLWLILSVILGGMSVKEVENARKK